MLLKLKYYREWVANIHRSQQSESLPGILSCLHWVQYKQIGSLTKWFKFSESKSPVEIQKWFIETYSQSNILWIKLMGGILSAKSSILIITLRKVTWEGRLHAIQMFPMSVTHKIYELSSTNTYWKHSVRRRKRKYNKILKKRKMAQHNHLRSSKGLTDKFLKENQSNMYVE